MKLRLPYLFLSILVNLALVQIASASGTILADSDWLESHIDDGNLKILEVRHDPHRYHSIGHIQGAIQVQRYRDLTNHYSTPMLRYPDKTQFQQTLRNWGINDDSLIVIYGDSRTVMASRLYFLLDLYGFDMSNVRILNGGTIEWTAFNELEKSTNTPPQGNVILKPARGLLVEWMEVHNLKLGQLDSSTTLVDTRPHVFYTGEQINHSLAGGHIPGAINVVSLDATDAATQTWFEDDALAEFYAGIDKNHPVILYDIGGFRAPLAYAHLKHLGYKDVKIYNGGWDHWGNTQTLPVVKGEEPYGEEYSL